MKNILDKIAEDAQTLPPDVFQETYAHVKRFIDDLHSASEKGLLKKKK